MTKFLQNLPPWSMTTAVSLVILYLTLVPQPLPEDTPPLFPGADKLVHAIMFGALAAAIVLDARRRGTAACRRMEILAGVISSVAGGLIELLQWWMDAGRSGETVDFAADVAGACLGAWAGHKIAKIILRRQP